MEELETPGAGDETMSAFDRRYSLTIPPAYLVAYLVDPSVGDEIELTSEERNCAPCFGEKPYDETGFPTTLVRFEAKSAPFSPAMFSREILNGASALY